MFQIANFSYPTHTLKPLKSLSIIAFLCMGVQQGYTLVQNVEQPRKTGERYLFSAFYIYFLCVIRKTPLSTSIACLTLKDKDVGIDDSFACFCLTLSVICSLFWTKVFVHATSLSTHTASYNIFLHTF